jgi:hypothetical protein
MRAVASAAGDTPERRHRELPLYRARTKRELNHDKRAVRSTRQSATTRSLPPRARG